MNTELNKPSLDGEDDSSSLETQQGKIKEVRKLIGPQSGKLALYCSDASIARYLRARNWNVKKAVKMLKATLKWRLEYKPEELRWDDVAMEAETGKIYRSSYKDKHGRPVLVMRPRCQNTKSTKGQIRYLVYCMENAILNVSDDQEQMNWLIDFHGFSLSNVSLKVTKETAHVLQDHYPERLGVAILYDAPKIFEPFWKMAKPFLEPKTTNKVKFVYSDDPNTIKIMDELFDMELVESAFGGKNEQDFDINEYAARMREDDKKLSSLWKTDPSLPPPPPATKVTDANSTMKNSDSNSEASYIKAERSNDDGDDTSPKGSLDAL
ncbi:Sec14p-like phosphatidylinositol transfer family protein [Perilla frutescens var. hirtella]|nr:Sec14p-like phosphatidylinositol transfer family protein [Perilla frutescens var. hirtella]